MFGRVVLRDMDMGMSESVFWSVGVQNRFVACALQGLYEGILVGLVSMMSRRWTFQFAEVLRCNNSH